MSGEFVYSGMALQDIKGGKIAAMQVERANFTVNTQQAGKADKMTGEIANLSSRDFDANAAAAILDPQKANDDRYYSFYGKTSAGPYTVTSALGLRMRIDQMTIDGVGARPSRLQLPALLAMIQAAGAASPTPAQTRELIDKMAALYEGMRIGTAEMRGLSAETPQGPFKLAGDQVQPGRRQDRRVCGRRARYKHAERARQDRTLRAQVAGYRQLHADIGAVREPGAAALARTDRGAVSAHRGRRDQGRHGALQEHRQVRQPRRLRRELGPICRPHSEQGAPDRENDHAGRCGRSFHESAHRGRAGYAFGRW